MSESNAVLDMQDLDEEFYQYLTFYIHNDILGVDLQQVREILEVKGITILPRTPDYMRGVINLRGQVIPIIDLKLKFSMGETELSVDSCIIIIEIIMNGDAVLVGALADSVRDVVDLSTRDIDIAPKMGAGIDSKFITGVSMHEDEFFSLLNVDELFSIKELLVGAATGPVSSQIN